MGTAKEPIEASCEGGTSMSTPIWDVPQHLLIPVNENGEGPVPLEEAEMFLCWCGIAECPGEIDEQNL